MKRFLALFLSISILINVCFFFTNNAKAESYYANYEGDHTPYLTTCTCSFSIYELNSNTFTGHIYNSESPHLDEDVTGTLYMSNNSYECVFFANNGNNSFDITVYPHEGRANCTAGGSGILLYDEFSMTGTVDKLFGVNWYNDDDMRMCMDLSNSVYTKFKNIQSTTPFENTSYSDYSIPNQLTSVFEQYGINKNLNNILSVCYRDDNKDNVAFTVCRRENDYNNDDIIDNVDIIVIIRGTLDDEWQGNAEITGESYISSKQEHDNFYKAKDSIKEGIQAYYDNLIQVEGYNSSQVNLIITGHSRGAAVANIYAKEATDNINSSTPNDDIPVFNKVTAYTFACPNVNKYYNGMENYNNIFNFCLKEDIVPTVPLTKPIEGWDYWKFGKTFSFNVSKEYNRIYEYPFISPYATSDIWNAFSYWKSVDEYYNKQIYGVASLEDSTIPTTTMYNTLHDLTGIKPGVSIKRASISGRNILNKIGVYPELIPVFSAAITNLGSIVTAHNYTTYNDIVQKYGSSGFELVTHSDISEINDSRVPHLENNTTSFDSTEEQLLRNFANSYSNLTKLGWDLSDPSTWDGVYWDENGHVYGFDLSFKNLDGVLDIASFPNLKYLYLSGNNLHLQSIGYCTTLEEIDCSYNDYSNETLDFSSNTNLKKVNCDGCNLNSVNVSNLSNLESLSCSFNSFSSMSVTGCTALNYFSCNYNYLDTSANSSFTTTLNNLQNNGCYVNSYPQSVPDNAVFNTAELNALRAFAMSGDNNDALDWLDENDNIDTDKLQKNVLFEYDGTQYRVAVIDIADLEISGSLDLDSFTKLSEFYCENTGITALDLSDCTSLEILSCYNSEIETFSLPSNITSSNSPLYQIDCEYNHIDTSIFTQSIIDSIEAKTDYVLEYENQKYEDSSALEAALEFAGTLRSSDYSEESFTVLCDLVEEYSDFENMLLTQDDVNEMTAEILTAISDLVPYLKLRTVYENGTVSITKDGQPVSTKYTSALSGTPITLTATPEEGYIFNGWYELTAKRIFSTSSTYSFNLTTNLSFEAQFVPTGSATLTFTNDTGQIVDKVTKTAQEWANTSSLSDLLPEVPYKLGHTGGQWTYVESDILTALASGTDSYISPTYSASEFVYPEIPEPVNNKPVSNLTFSYNETEDIGSFIMAAGIPQELDIEAIGVAFYKGKKETFNPDSYILNINNKSLVSRFDGRESDGLYIVNIHSFSVKNNWCARGFITYRDGNELKTHYTNQINVTNTTQNGLRRIIPRSIIFEDSEGGIDMDYDGEAL